MREEEESIKKNTRCYSLSCSMALHYGLKDSPWSTEWIGAGYKRSSQQVKKYGTVSLVCVELCVAIKTFDTADTKLGIRVACISIMLENRACEDKMESVYQ